MFERGKIYNRRELHNKYGGNRQGGIANCASHPFIFLFSGKAGEKHGYEDSWDDQNYFITGEGQLGDMQFTKGNLAIRDHVKNGKSIYLFKFKSKAFWEYIDEIELVDYDYFNTPDNDGKIRRAIKFKFISRKKETEEKDELEQKSNNSNKPDKTERQGLVTSRVGQGWYRKAILERWQYKCAVSGCELIDILIASHIVPWKDANDSERLDVDNGFLLSPNLDALFDKHLISFQDDGIILIAKTLSKDLLKKLGINGNERITKFTKGNLVYLEKHRKKFYENN